MNRSEQMNQLHEAYEQMTKMNAEIIDYWRKVMSETPWMGGSQSFMGERSNPWIEAMRSGYQASLSGWNQMLDESLEMFFKSLKETRNYRQAMEKQIRENWEELKKAQQTQQEKTQEFFSNLANFLKEEVSPPPS
jgi:hypothetical protein